MEGSGTRYQDCGHCTSGGRGFKPVSSFRETRRDLPHLQEPGRTYFITFRTQKGDIPEAVRSIVLKTCLFWNGRKCEVHACVVMPDHVHLLLTPLLAHERRGYYSLSEILHSIKSFSAQQINRLLGRTGRFWLSESFDRVIRNEQEFWEKRQYIRNNPVKRELAERTEEYSYLYEESGAPGEHRQDACATPGK